MVQQFQQADQPARQGRVKAESRYPVYDLDSSIDVARAIRDRGGGTATQQQLASFLSYKSITSGAFITRIAAARLFGLIETNGQFLTVSRLASVILAPERPGVDDQKGRVEAYFNVPLYRSLYERYKSGQLPPEMGLRNALETHYGVPRARTQIAYRVLMDSAGQAGLYSTREGQRTHWVIPIVEAGDDQTGETWDTTQPPLSVPMVHEVTRPPTQLRAEASPTRRLRQILVDKVREIEASDLETLHEYLKLIDELEEKERREKEESDSEEPE